MCVCVCVRVCFLYCLNTCPSGYGIISCFISYPGEYAGSETSVVIKRKDIALRRPSLLRNSNSSIVGLLRNRAIVREPCETGENWGRPGKLTVQPVLRTCVCVCVAGYGGSRPNVAISCRMRHWWPIEKAFVLCSVVIKRCTTYTYFCTVKCL